MLLSTKLHVPTHERELVPRPRLLELLDGGRDCKLTLVTAPPGWGKSTLVSEWCAQVEHKGSCAWVSLDEGDNDSVRFWSYIVEALREWAPRTGAAAPALLRAPGTTIVDDVLPKLINELADSEVRQVLVLDDYHEIRNASIHEELVFLLRHLPHCLQLVIVTRADPPVRLARLRAGREVTEIRMDELRFSEDEAISLLNGILRLGLDPSDASTLQRRTEGWVAGLQLAALSLRGRSDAPSFVSAFAGDDRHVVDFLASEVMARQSNEVRDFLVRTSILQRICGPLCDIVVGRQGSTELLQEIERSNLFLVALDSKRRWYRYHHLFAELLRFELEREEPSLVATLHRRAAAWHLGQGFTAAAIHHTIAAGDHSEASDLITVQWYEFLQQGRLGTVSGWLSALPERIVESDARLCLIRAWMAVNSGQLDEVDWWTEVAERLTVDNPGDEAPVLQSGVVNLRAIHRYMNGNISEAVAAGQHALELDAKLDLSPWHPVGCPVLGVALFWSGRSDDAQGELQEAVREAEAGGNNLSKLHALGGLAAINAERGDFDEAGHIAETAIRFGEDRGLSEHWAATLALVVHGKVLEQRGQLERAEAVLDRGLELSRRGVASMEITYALLALARVRRRQGDRPGSKTLLDRALETTRRCADAGIMPELLNETRRSVQGSGASRHKVGSGPEHLTERELAVLRLLQKELSQKEIAAELYVSHNTVKTHMRGLYRKLDASSRAEAVARAHDFGLS